MYGVIAIARLQSCLFFIMRHYAVLSWYGQISQIVRGSLKQIYSRKIDRIENLQHGICSQGHIRFYERKYGMLLLILNKSININLYLYLGILMIYREKYNFCEKIVSSSGQYFILASRQLYLSRFIQNKSHKSEQKGYT